MRRILAGLKVVRPHCAPGAPPRPRLRSTDQAPGPGNEAKQTKQQPIPTPFMGIPNTDKDSASSLLRGQQIESLGKHSAGRVEHGTPARAVCPSSAAARKDRLRVDAGGGNAICVTAQGFARYLIRCASRRLPSSAPFLLSA
jgi:hypothetical protein